LSRERSAAPQSTKSTSTTWSWSPCPGALSLSSVGEANTHSQIRLYLPKRCCSEPTAHEGGEEEEGKDDASTLLEMHTVLTHLPNVPNTFARSGPWYTVHRLARLHVQQQHPHKLLRHHASTKWQSPIHHVKRTPHADSGRSDVASSESESRWCRWVRPRLKAVAGRLEAQRFAHTMGKRKRLGRPPLDLLARTLRIRPAWDHPRLARLVRGQPVQLLGPTLRIAAT